MSAVITGCAHLWQPLADNYDLAALRNIGHLYRLGQGVARDGEKAVRYYTRAAELGFAPAQLNLAVMLYEGDGIPTDTKLHVTGRNARQMPDTRRRSNGLSIGLGFTGY